MADASQGRGLGTLLLGHLAEVATANRVDTFVAQVLPANHRMLTAAAPAWRAALAAANTGW